MSLRPDLPDRAGPARPGQTCQTGPDLPDQDRPARPGRTCRTGPRGRWRPRHSGLSIPNARAESGPFAADPRSAGGCRAYPPTAWLAARLPPARL